MHKNKKLGILVFLVTLFVSPLAMAFEDCHQVLSAFEGNSPAQEFWSRFYDKSGALDRSAVQKEALAAVPNERSLSFLIRGNNEIISQRRYKAVEGGTRDLLVSSTAKRDKENRLSELTLKGQSTRHKLNIGVGPKEERQYNFFYKGGECFVASVDEGKRKVFDYNSCFKIQQVLQSSEECPVASECHRSTDPHVATLMGKEPLTDKPELVSSNYKVSLDYVFKQKCSAYKKYQDLAAPVKTMPAAEGSKKKSAK